MEKIQLTTTSPIRIEVSGIIRIEENVSIAGNMDILRETVEVNQQLRNSQTLSMKTMNHHY